MTTWSTQPVYTPLTESVATV